MAHIHEKIDFTASIYIVFNNKVLLHKHKKLGIWLPPGGHIELDEDPNQAAIREAREETGLDIELIGNPQAGLPQMTGRQDLIPPKFLNRHFFDKKTGEHEHVDLVYFGRAKSADAKHEIEGGEIAWFSKEDIERNDVGIFPDIQKYALLVLEELSS
jgi:8-oxo-dGTP pyrophosphatase MutT (NUDIX family)